LHTSDLTLLFSSYDAIDHDAPSYDERLGHVAALHGDTAAAPPAPAPPGKQARAARFEVLRRLIEYIASMNRRVPSGSR
jgi:hypothetical protein